jgi:hypothetical protein
VHATIQLENLKRDYLQDLGIDKMTFLIAVGDIGLEGVTILM